MCSSPTDGVRCGSYLATDGYLDPSLLTTAGTSLYALDRIGGLKGGETVVVSGPGPIGLMAVVLARLTGAASGRVLSNPTVVSFAK